MSLNLILFNFVHQFVGRNVFLDDVAVFFANYLIYLLVIGFLVLVIYENGTRRKLYLFAEGALAVILSRGILTEVIRFFYHHPRPFDALGFTPLVPESGPSFPSGHMTFIFALAMVVWYVNRRWGIWYFILGALMGIARIYVGVHWPLDILGGIVIGVLSGMAIRAALRKSREGLSPETLPPLPR